MNNFFGAFLVATFFAVARFLVPVEGAVSEPDIFKDFAHLFVGGLFVAGLKANCFNSPCRSYAMKGQWLRAWWRCRDWQYLVLAVSLTVLEVVAFIVRKR